MAQQLKAHTLSILKIGSSLLDPVFLHFLLKIGSPPKTTAKQD